jgi:hypothetical protein
MLSLATQEEAGDYLLLRSAPHYCGTASPKMVFDVSGLQR